eukprot:5694348-Pyramimonas_sp.AAC.1
MCNKAQSPYNRAHPLRNKGTPSVEFISDSQVIWLALPTITPITTHTLTSTQPNLPDQRWYWASVAQQRQNLTPLRQASPLGLMCQGGPEGQIVGGQKGAQGVTSQRVTEGYTGEVATPYSLPTTTKQTTRGPSLIDRTHVSSCGWLPLRAYAPLPRAIGRCLKSGGGGGDARHRGAEPFVSSR